MTKKKKYSKIRNKNVPKFPLGILADISSKDIWECRVNESISEFNYLLEVFPDLYGWKFRTKEAIDAEVKDACQNQPSALKINYIYWEDTLKNLEAYTVMSVWRTAELLRNAVASLIAGETVVSAILARSALETVVQFVDVARKVSPTISAVLMGDFSKDIMISDELEGLILKSVFSSRMPGSEEIYSPTNIVTIISRAAKSPGQEGISVRYAELCEVAHPNFLGRSVYLRAVEQGNRPGEELRTLSRDHGLTALGISRSAVWAISWSAATQVSSTRLMQSSVGAAIKKLKTTFH